MALPTKKNKIKIDIYNHVALWYGPPGGGKTPIAAQFEDILFIASEQKHGHVNAYIQNVGSWNDMKKVVKELKKIHADGEFPYKAICVDTVDIIYAWCEESVNKKHGVDFIGDLGYGKGYKACRKEFEKWIRPLTRLGVTVIFVAHDKKTTTQNMIGELESVELDLEGQLKKIMRKMVYQILYIGVEEYEKVVIVKDKKTGKKKRKKRKWRERTMVCDEAHEAIECKDSYSILPATIPLGNDPETAFKNYSQHWPQNSSIERK